ncbi:MAG: autotransporter outer membrane beta-barrel domain-containing protein, partial [Planctomycetota bacterium]
MKGKKREKLIIGAVGLFLILAVMPGAAYAEVPAKINYQGFLTDGGTPVDTDGVPVEMTFSIYCPAGSPVPDWSEIQQVEVSNGIFNVTLNVNSDIFQQDTQETCDLGVEVESEGEMSPRKQITSVVFSIRAELAESALLAESANYATDAYSATIAGDAAHATTADSATTAGDADTVDNQHAGAFALDGHGHSGGDINSGTVADGFIAATIARDSEIMPKVLANDGPGTGLNADLLDGAHSNAFATSGHSHSAHWHYSLNAADGIPTNALVVDDEGEVGIGTPGDPGSKLDVNGNVNTSGAYKIKGATAFTIQTGPTELNTIIGLAAGHNTGGFANTFMGHGAGGGANSGNRNTFLGYNTGIGNTVGPDNTFIGYAAGDANTTGGRNTIIGSNAGMDSTGSLNTFIGYAAGKSTSAQGNAFIGYEAGLSNIVGEYNNFLGYFAGRSNILGDYNTFVGPLTGMSNTTGHQNTFVGYAAGNENISGGGNTFIGAGAGSQNNGTGNVFLGQEAGPADPAASNQLYIGNYTTKRNTLIYGEFDNTRVGIGTTTPSGTLHVVGGDALEGAGSDITLHAQNAGGPGLNGGDIILLPGDGIIPGMPGGVGIGTTTPTGTLDVAGEIWAQEG